MIHLTAQGAIRTNNNIAPLIAQATTKREKGGLDSESLNRRIIRAPPNQSNKNNPMANTEPHNKPPHVAPLLRKAVNRHHPQEIAA